MHLLFVALGLFGAASAGLFPDDQIGQRSYEWTSKTTRRFEIDLGPILRNAIRNQMDIHYLVNCNAPVQMYLMKCGVVFLESDGPFQAGHFILAKSWREYLFQKHTETCFMGTRPEEYFEVMFTSTEIYTCKMTWKLNDPVNDELVKFKNSMDVDQKQNLTGYPMAFDPTNQTMSTLTHNFKSPVRFFVGKCGLFHPKQIAEHGELTKHDIHRIQRFQDVKCAVEHNDGFRVYIFATDNIKGFFSFGPKEINIKKKGFIWFGILCGVFGVTGIFFCPNVRAAIFKSGEPAKTAPHPVYTEGQ